LEPARLGLGIGKGQYGFGFDVVGNLISEDDQKCKLELVVETARQVWGWARRPKRGDVRCLLTPERRRENR
jgi:hypothetical protein